MRKRKERGKKYFTLKNYKLIINYEDIKVILQKLKLCKDIRITYLNFKGK